MSPGDSPRNMHRDGNHGISLYPPVRHHPEKVSGYPVAAQFSLDEAMAQDALQNLRADQPSGPFPKSATVNKCLRNLHRLLASNSAGNILTMSRSFTARTPFIQPPLHFSFPFFKQQLDRNAGFETERQ